MKLSTKQKLYILHKVKEHYNTPNQDFKKIVICYAMCLKIRDELANIYPIKLEDLTNQVAIELWKDRDKSKVKVKEYNDGLLWYLERMPRENIEVRVKNIERTIKRLQKPVTYIEKVTMYLAKCLKCRFWQTKTIN